MRKIVGGVSVEVDAKTGRFRQGMAAAEKTITKFGRSAKLNFEGVKKQARQFDREFDQLTRRFSGFAAVLGGVSVAGTVAGLVSVNREVEKFRASLETVTGSQAAAQKSFDQILEFTKTTPFQVDQVTDSFIRLKSYGLDPSMAALQSYGNTASAMGKSLNQVIEAVADAATGEFERLKEFGIKASSEGDRVSFTFQGMTTTVEKNAAEIEAYLQSIGNIEFAGAMQKQMDTLDGRLSNMRDSFYRLAISVGEAGLNDLLREATTEVGELAGAINKFVNNPASMPDWLKLTAFTVKSLVVEFKDLGDWIGAVGAIVGQAMQFNFDAIDQIVAGREERRAAVDEELQNYVARLEGFAERVNEIKESSGLGAMMPAASEGGGEREVVTPIMTDEEFAKEFARADAQFEKLNKLYAKKAADREKVEARHSKIISDMKFAVAQQAIGFVKLVAGEQKGVQIAILAAEKGLAIAQTKIQTEVAAMRALAELGPIAGPPAAASIRTMGAVSIGLIAATGIAEAAGLGSGGGSGVGGVPVSDTVSTTPALPPTIIPDQSIEGGEATAAPAATGQSLTFNINGVITDEIVDQMIIPAITDAVDKRDVIVFRRESAQGEELLPA